MKWNIGILLQLAKRKSWPLFQVPKERTRPAIRLGSGKALDPVGSESIP
jgi:hypothetical protein